MFEDEDWTPLICSKCGNRTSVFELSWLLKCGCGEARHYKIPERLRDTEQEEWFVRFRTWLMNALETSDKIRVTRMVQKWKGEG